MRFDKELEMRIVLLMRNHTDSPIYFDYCFSVTRLLLEYLDFHVALKNDALFLDGHFPQKLNDLFDSGFV